MTSKSTACASLISRTAILDPGVVFHSRHQRKIEPSLSSANTGRRYLIFT
jgi:hypothetical protein